MTSKSATTLDEVYARVSKQELRAMTIQELMDRADCEYTSAERFTEAFLLVRAWELEHPGEIPDMSVLGGLALNKAWRMWAAEGLPDVSALDPLPDGFVSVDSSWLADLEST